MQDELVIDATHTEWSSDMAGLTNEQRIASLEAKLGNAEKKLESLDTIGGDLREIKSDLGWHSKIGWALAGVYAVIFVSVLGWVLGIYIPDKFNDKLPANFREDWGKLQQNVNTIQDRLSRFTPSTLNQLLSPVPGVKPDVAQLNLEKAAKLIDVSLGDQIPGNPSLLSPLNPRVTEIANQYPTLKELANSTNIRISAYTIASGYMLQGKTAITQEPPQGQRLLVPFLIGFTIACTHPEAHFFARGDTLPVVFDVSVERCAQNISHSYWVKDQFHGSTIEYNGGPLNLADVQFFDCKFKFGSDLESKRALAVISAANHGQPVTPLIPDSSADQ